MNFLKFDTNILLAALLISGTSIGAGILGLPVVAGQYGFTSSIIVLAVACFFMTLGGLYLSDATLATNIKNCHLISLSGHFFGWKGKVLSWLVFLFISLISFVCYVSEGGKILGDYLQALGINISYNHSYLVYLTLFIAVMLGSSRVVGRINATLFLLLILSFALLFSNLLPFVSTATLETTPPHCGSALKLLPLMLTVFSFPGVVPGLVGIVGYDRNKARKAIILGTSLGFVVSGTWMAVVMGIIPGAGENGLVELYEKDRSVTLVLASIVDTPIFLTMANLFGFLAISTSYLGVGWSLNKFLLDGFGLEGLKSKTLINVAVALFTLTLIGTFDKLFYLALETSGGIGDSLVSGIIPASMAFVAKYKFANIEEKTFRLRKPTIFTVIVFFTCVALNEIYHLCI